MMEPTYSPWGEIQHCRVLCPYVYDVDTASHGGIMVEARKAHSVFSEAALGCAFQEMGYYCFEEDCAATVALRELMDKNSLPPRSTTTGSPANTRPASTTACGGITRITGRPGRRL